MNCEEIELLEEALKVRNELYAYPSSYNQDKLTILPDRKEQPDLDVKYIQIVIAGGYLSMVSVMNAVEEATSELRSITETPDYTYPRLELEAYSPTPDPNIKTMYSQSWVFKDTDFK